MLSTEGKNSREENATSLYNINIQLQYHKIFAYTNIMSTFCTKQHHILQWRMQGAHHGEQNGCLGWAPSGVQGHSLWWGVTGLKLKAFYQFHAKKVARTWGFKWKFAPVSEADCFAPPWPALSFGQWGGGRPPSPPIAGSAADITSCTRMHRQFSTYLQKCIEW